MAVSKRKAQLSQVKKELFHGGLEHCTFNFEVPGETLVALHNALSFTMAHHDEYHDESDGCPHCMEAMHALRNQVGNILTHAGVYKKIPAKRLN